MTHNHHPPKHRPSKPIQTAKAEMHEAAVHLLAAAEAFRKTDPPHSHRPYIAKLAATIELMAKELPLE